jgi:hypothetical protein
MIGNRLLPKDHGDWFVSFMVAITSVSIAFFAISFYRTAANFALLGDDVMPNLGVRSFFAIALLSIVLFALFRCLQLGKLSKLCHFVYRHRVAIGICLVAFCTAFEISGTSIAIIGNYVGGSDTEGVLFGIPRSVRSDEWAVMTPFAFSQEYTGYSSISDLLRGGSTDVTMVYAQPCWAFPTLFRPFLWGYLLLKSTRGLAFFWSARLVALFLVSEAFARLMFGEDRKVSVAFALMVTFSGTVQWWFAVNGTAELFIFGELLVISFSRMLHSDCSNHLARFGLTLAIAWLCVAFVLVIYPAWQVVLFWVFFAIVISLCIQYLREGHAVRDLLTQICPLLFALLLTGVAVAACFVPVLDVIKTVSATEYPGSRKSLGGGLALTNLFNWGSSLAEPLAASHCSPNACEKAMFFSPAPLGAILALGSIAHSIHKKSKADPVLLPLAIVELVFLIYCFVGVPDILSTVTFLSHSTSSRVLQMMGYVDLILLFRLATFRLATDRTDNVSDGKARATGLIISLFAVAVLSVAGAVSGGNIRLALVALNAVGMFCLLASLILIRGKVPGANMALLVVSVLVALSGAAVNPVQHGAAALTDSDTASVVREYSDSDDLWITEGSVLGDLCIANGASCINSVNTYPRLDVWSTLDPDGMYKSVYNRYAHIIVVPTTEATTFKLNSADSFTVELNLDDARKIGITKWLISVDLAAYDTESTQAVKVADAGQRSIWELEDVRH